MCGKNTGARFSPDLQPSRLGVFVFVWLCVVCNCMFARTRVSKCMCKLYVIWCSTLLWSFKTKGGYHWWETVKGRRIQWSLKRGISRKWEALGRSVAFNDLLRCSSTSLRMKWNFGNGDSICFDRHVLCALTKSECNFFFFFFILFTFSDRSDTKWLLICCGCKISLVKLDWSMTRLVIKKIDVVEKSDIECHSLLNENV